MKYRQLQSLVSSRTPGRNYTLQWNVTAGIEATYNIIPLPNSTYLIHSSSGRGDWYRQCDSDGLPLVFTSEDDVCDYVWTDYTKERPAPIVVDVPVHPPEYYAEKNRQLVARLKARGPAPVVYPNETELNNALHAYFGLVGRSSGEHAVAERATTGQRPTLLAAVATVLNEVDAIEVEDEQATPGRYYRMLIRKIAGQHPSLDLKALIALADRRFDAGHSAPLSSTAERFAVPSNLAQLERQLAKVLPPSEIDTAVSLRSKPAGSPTSYTLVPLLFGRFALYRSLPDGEVYRQLSRTGRRLVFRNEAAICRYVFEQLTE